MKLKKGRHKLKLKWLSILKVKEGILSNVYLKVLDFVLFLAVWYKACQKFGGNLNLNSKCVETKREKLLNKALLKLVNGAFLSFKLPRAST